jgi:hypothetical protein
MQYLVPPYSDRNKPHRAEDYELRSMSAEEFLEMTRAMLLLPSKLYIDNVRSRSQVTVSSWFYDMVSDFRVLLRALDTKIKEGDEFERTNS